MVDTSGEQKPNAYGVALSRLLLVYGKVSFHVPITERSAAKRWITYSKRLISGKQSGLKSGSPRIFASYSKNFIPS